jgi:thiamine biosynthesis lipoprotein
MFWKKEYRKKSLLVAAVGILILGFLGWYYFTPKSRLYFQQYLYFGTVINVKLIADSNENAKDAFHHLDQELARMHRDWHAWQPSLITQINAACGTGETIIVPDDLADLLEKGKKFYTLSDGLFNPAAAKLIGAWGFLNNSPNRDRVPPDEALIDSLLQKKPSMADIEIHKNRVKCTNPAVQLDLGGYAKGYAIDNLLDYLSRQGISNALIDAGGDIGIRGQMLNRPWKIAIKNPFSKDPIKIIEVIGPMSVFTSGNYAREFNHDNTHYTHIINPSTGKPVTGFISVTVLHKDATTADAAATSLMVAGPTQWKKIAKQFGLEKVYAVTADEVLEWPISADSNTH